jgi:hypothetical protein
MQEREPWRVHLWADMEMKSNPNSMYVYPYHIIAAVKLLSLSTAELNAIFATCSAAVPIRQG